MCDNPYTKVRDVLINAGIIGKGTSYQVGNEQVAGRCMSYWIMDEYRDKKPSLIEIPERRMKKIKVFDYDQFLSQYNNITFATTIPLLTYDYLRKCVQHRLGISISEEQLEGLKEERIYKGKKKDGTEKWSKLGNMDYNFIEVLDKRASSQIMVNIGTQSGRMFSPITQMFRGVRKFLKIDGYAQCCEVDIKTSQPCFIYTMVRDKYGDTPDLLEWKRLCQEGILYEELMKCVDLEPTKENRDAFKSQYFFEAIYGPNVRLSKTYRTFVNKEWVEMYKDATLFTYIRKRFPTLHKYMLEAKNGYSLKKEDYNQFVIEAQKREADLMIGKVVPALLAHKSSMCIFTLHDSIITSKEYQCVVEKEILNAFQNLNIQPMLESKLYL
jgi:hypothetical protein